MSYCAYTAATILIFDLRARTPGTAVEAMRQLEIILAALTSQTTVTPSVRKAVEIIRHLMANAPSSNDTPALQPNPSSLKRTRFEEPRLPLPVSSVASPSALASDYTGTHTSLLCLRDNLGFW